MIPLVFYLLLLNSGSNKLFIGLTSFNFLLFKIACEADVLILLEFQVFLHLLILDVCRVFSVNDGLSLTIVRLMFIELIHHFVTFSLYSFQFLRYLI